MYTLWIFFLGSGFPFHFLNNVVFLGAEYFNCAKFNLSFSLMINESFLSKYLPSLKFWRFFSHLFYQSFITLAFKFSSVNYSQANFSVCFDVCFQVYFAYMNASFSSTIYGKVEPFLHWIACLKSIDCISVGLCLDYLLCFIDPFLSLYQ